MRGSPVEIELYTDKGIIRGTIFMLYDSKESAKIEADILEGHYSTAHCHLGNIPCYYQEHDKESLPELKNPQWTLGQKLASDPAME